MHVCPECKSRDADQFRGTVVLQVCEDCDYTRHEKRLFLRMLAETLGLIAAVFGIVFLLLRLL